jgi:hypothetical protein
MHFRICRTGKVGSTTNVRPFKGNTRNERGTPLLIHRKIITIPRRHSRPHQFASRGEDDTFNVCFRKHRLRKPIALPHSESKNYWPRQRLPYTTMRKASTSIATSLTRNVPRRRLHQNVIPTTQITTLPNKIKVATESTPGHFSSIGLYVEAGSRYETPSTSGVSHFLDRMAFKASFCVIA